MQTVSNIVVEAILALDDLDTCVSHASPYLITVEGGCCYANRPLYIHHQGNLPPKSVPLALRFALFLEVLRLARARRLAVLGFIILPGACACAMPSLPRGFGRALSIFWPCYYLPNQFVLFHYYRFGLISHDFTFWCFSLSMILKSW